MNDASPFARKVRVAAAERGLDRGIELVRLNPHERGAELVAANPLSKVPHEAGSLTPGPARRARRTLPGP